jgi:hypothetical protein
VCDIVKVITLPDDDVKRTPSLSFMSNPLENFLRHIDAVYQVPPTPSPEAEISVFLPYSKVFGISRKGGLPLFREPDVVISVDARKVG